MSVVESLCLDTNVPVYSFDRNEPVKGPKADNLLRLILAAGRPLISVQVLSEFYWTVTRKLRVPMSHEEAAAQVRSLATMSSVVPVSWQVLDKALELRANHGLALWDAQIVAVAALNGGRWVLSEDFQHRQTIEGITCLNPFADDFDAKEILPP